MLEALVLTEFFKCEIQIWSTRSLEEKICLGAAGFLFPVVLKAFPFLARVLQFASANITNLEHYAKMATCKEKASLCDTASALQAQAGFWFLSRQLKSESVKLKPRGFAKIKKKTQFEVFCSENVTSAMAAKQATEQQDC